MFASAEHQLIYRVTNATVNTYPFPHIYVEDVFPADFYRQIRQHLPPRDAFTPLGDLVGATGDYAKTRRVMLLEAAHLDELNDPLKKFWSAFAAWLIDGRFPGMALQKFASQLTQRFPDFNSREFFIEGSLIHDDTDYYLLPHTDVPQKVLSFLIYLPEDDTRQHLGTSIYVPRDPSMTCDGSKHWDASLFERVATMPYKPNSMFAFVKTQQSFHGVERVQEADIRRDLLFLDLKTRL